MQYPKNVKLTQETYDNATHSSWLLNGIFSSFNVSPKDYITMCESFLYRIITLVEHPNVNEGLNVIEKFMEGKFYKQYDEIYPFAISECNKAIKKLNTNYDNIVVNNVASAVYHTLRGILGILSDCVIMDTGKKSYTNEGITAMEATIYTAETCLLVIKQANINLSDELYREKIFNESVEQCNIIRKILGNKITFPDKTVIKPELEPAPEVPEVVELSIKFDIKTLEITTEVLPCTLIDYNTEQFVCKIVRSNGKKHNFFPKAIFTNGTQEYLRNVHISYLPQYYEVTYYLFPENMEITKTDAHKRLKKLIDSYLYGYKNKVSEIKNEISYLKESLKEAKDVYKTAEEKHKTFLTAYNNYLNQ